MARRRRRRHATSSCRRFEVPYRFEALLDRIQTQLQNLPDKSIKAAFPILEALAGIVGKKTMLEALRWQQAGLVRLLEPETNPRSRRSTAFQQFQTVDRLATEESKHIDCSVRSPPDRSTESSPAELSFFEVTPMRASHNAHQLLPNVNFCSCREFQNQVIKRKKRITCSHVLAVWLSKCLHSYTHVVIPKRMTDLIKRYMINGSREFS
ncbi:hypothetical protein V3C99_013418 [Haemonchus contortus]